MIYDDAHTVEVHQQEDKRRPLLVGALE